MLRHGTSIFLLAGIACGGTVETIHPDATGASDGSGGSGHASGGGASEVGGAGGSSSGGFPTGGIPGGGGPATGGSLPTGGTVDPGCPDQEPPPPNYACDPLEPEATCPEGFACYPYVSHPFGTGCDTQQFGAACTRAGTGQHGDFCGDEHGRCAPGYLCVVGANPGKRCAQLCTLDGEHDCPAGLICGETDVAGYGVCY